ncbi:MAG: NACHT domain-containing protein [Caldilineaceae bacterium]
MPRLRHSWLLPATAALILFLGGVAANWVAADLQDDLEPYRPWVWGAFGLALIVTVVLAVRERQGRRDPIAPAPRPRAGRDYIAGDHVAGDQVAGDQVGGDQVGGDQIIADLHEQSEKVAIGKDITQINIDQVVYALTQRLPPRQLQADEIAPLTKLYLNLLIDRYQFLDFKGMGVTDRVALQLPLLEMFIPLRARRELPDGETAARRLRLAGRQVSEEEALAMGERLTEPVNVLKILREQDGLIVLGDPGAGKTTLLKVLALLLALGQGDELGLPDYLPVLIPLSAYANALAAGDVALQDFLGDYYTSLGIPLPVRELLAAFLAAGRTLLLMDGLDEVQEATQRTTLVNRFEAFFAAHRPAGNKFVLSSRIVGYQEIRPSAKGLVECTLVDFDDDDIAAFVERWSRAVERAVQGDTPTAQQQAQQEGGELLAAIARNPGVPTGRQPTAAHNSGADEAAGGESARTARPTLRDLCAHAVAHLESGPPTRWPPQPRGQRCRDVARARPVGALDAREQYRRRPGQTGEGAAQTGRDLCAAQRAGP